MSYSDTTYNSKNPLARFAHRQRFKISIEFSNPQDGDKLLDYGCGDAKFLNSITTKCELVGYEPYMDSSPENTVKVFKTLDKLNEFTIANGKFNIVTCFEVMEHFSPKNQEQIVKEMIGFLEPNGVVIISVPIEIGFPPLVKNIRRMLLHPDPVLNFRNVTKSVLGKPLTEYRIKDGYLYHMGFYFKDLEMLLEKYFVVIEKKYSPLNFFGYNFNSQVFYKLILK